jgi:signal transduction histidine kinase
MSRTNAVTAVALALGLASVAVVIGLQQHADGRRQAQLELETLRETLAAYELLPWRVDAANAGSPTLVRTQMAQAQREIKLQIAHLRRTAPSHALYSFEPAMARATRDLVRTRETLISGILTHDLARARLQSFATGAKAYAEIAAADSALGAASVQYAREARRSLLEASLGSAFAVLALIGAFSVFFKRWARARQADERTRKRLHAVIANMPGMVYRFVRLNGAWTIEFLSDQLEATTGHNSGEFTDGRLESLRALVHPDDRLRVETEFAEAVAEERAFVLEYRLVDVAGDARFVYERAGAATRLPDGGLALDGMIVDVTDRRTAEQARDQLEQDLRIAQKLEAVGQLAAGIAHEINTPVQFVGDSVRFLDDAFADIAKLIAGYQKLLVEADAPEAAIADLEEVADLAYLTERTPVVFTRIYDGVERVATLVRAMKSFAHPSQTDRVLADLNEALRTTLTVARNEYKYLADIDLDLQEIPQVSCIVGDINQVFLNLIVNAAHAIEDTHRPEDSRGTIRIASSAAGDAVRFSFTDDGCGIAPDVCERVFDPFFTTKEVGRGSGQGLALSRAIVERHAGRLTVQSELGVGSTFTIDLPVEDVVRLEAARAA